MLSDLFHGQSSLAAAPPPLLQPRSPEFPAGVLTQTPYVPGPSKSAGPTVALIVVLLVTSVATRVLLTTTTDAATNCAPLRFASTVNEFNCLFTTASSTNNDLDGNARRFFRHPLYSANSM